MTDCKIIAKEYLKTLRPEEIEDISNHPDFTYTEKWIIFLYICQKAVCSKYLYEIRHIRAAIFQSST